MTELPFKISTLIIIHDEGDRLLMIKRSKAPNKGCWSPIGGKLIMSQGESPYECAIREVYEEVKMKLEPTDLHMWGYISEKNFEGDGHWLMFLFDCKKQILELPNEIDEGQFAFYSHAQLKSLHTPAGDDRLIWSHYKQYRNGFIAIRADCDPNKKLAITVEQSSLF